MQQRSSILVDIDIINFGRIGFSFRLRYFGFLQHFLPVVVEQHVIVNCEVTELFECISISWLPVFHWLEYYSFVDIRFQSKIRFSNQKERKIYNNQVLFLPVFAEIVRNNFFKFLDSREHGCKDSVLFILVGQFKLLLVSLPISISLFYPLSSLWRIPSYFHEPFHKPYFAFSLSLLPSSHRRSSFPKFPYVFTNRLRIRLSQIKPSRFYIVTFFSSEMKWNVRV